MLGSPGTAGCFVRDALRLGNSGSLHLVFASEGIAGLVLTVTILRLLHRPLQRCSASSVHSSSLVLVVSFFGVGFSASTSSIRWCAVSQSAWACW